MEFSWTQLSKEHLDSIIIPRDIVFPKPKFSDFFYKTGANDYIMDAITGSLYYRHAWFMTKSH